MRKHLLLFLLAVFVLILPATTSASPPEFQTAMAEGAFAISTDVPGAIDCPIMAAAALGVMHELQLRDPESGIASSDETQAQSTAKMTAAEYAQTMATLRTTTLETAATARSAPYDGTTIDRASSFTQNSTNPLNTNVTRSEVRAANLEDGADISPKSTMESQVNQIASAGSEVTVVIKWNDAVSQNTNPKNGQVAEESSFTKQTTRAPTTTVQMRC